MLKFFMMLSMLNATVNTDYVDIEKICHYQNNIDKKQIIFEIDSDYLTKHTLDVYISLYGPKDTYLLTYNNTLDVLGKKHAIANVECGNHQVEYVIIDVYYKELKIQANNKINFYHQQDCLLDEDNRSCNRIYKSEVIDGINKDYYTNFIMGGNLYNKFLIVNELDVEEIQFFSLYEFDEANVYFFVNDYIDKYQLPYNDKYIFLMNIKKDNKSYFSLVDEYYLVLDTFSYSDQYLENAIITNNIHFPFSEEYKEYNCEILIDDFIDIYIKFKVATSDNLFGDCQKSKFCLKREIYD